MPRKRSLLIVGDSKILFQVPTVVEKLNFLSVDHKCRGAEESSIRRHTSSATAHAFMTLLLCASNSYVERDLTSSSESLCRRRYVSNTSG